MASEANVRVWRGDDVVLPFLVDTAEDIALWVFEYRAARRQSALDADAVLVKASPEITMNAPEKLVYVPLEAGDTPDQSYAGGYFHTLTRTNPGAHVLLSWGCLEVRER